MSTAATIIVLILGFIVFYYVALYAASYRMRRAATVFLTALAQGHYVSAHALLSSAFQRLVSEQAFEDFLADRGISSMTRLARSHRDFSIGSASGSVKAMLVREDGWY